LSRLNIFLMDKDFERDKIKTDSYFEQICLFLSRLSFLYVSLEYLLDG
jgi:hypothetical protein